MVEWLLIPNPYPAYRPSSVEWLADVPTHWEVRRLRVVARIVNGATPSTNMSAYWDGDVIWLTPEDLGRLSTRYVERGARQITLEGYDSCGTNLAPAGSLAISTRAPIGHLGVLRSAACVNQGCRLLVPKRSLQSDYLYYMLKTSRGELESLGQGSTFVELSQKKLGEFAIAVPPLAEQVAIVRYLDHIDGRIRRSISAKERLAGLLEEQRQAVIHRAVTHGLDPDVQFKPSSIKWIGDVPAHWVVAPVKRHYSIQLGKMLQNRPTGLADVEVPYLKAQHVQWFSVRTTNAPTMWASPHEIEQFGIRAGDLLVCEGGEGGRCGLVKEVEPGYIIQNALHRVRPSGNCTNDYLRYVMISIAKTGWFDAINNKATIAHFTAEKFGSLLIPVPPLPEQVAIVEYLDKATADVDTAMARARRHVELLREYRTRLIADVVTGKLDVREAAMVLPEKADESNRLGETNRCPEPERANDHAD